MISKQGLATSSLDEETREILADGLGKALAAPTLNSTYQEELPVSESVGTVYIITKYDKDDLDRVNGDLIVDVAVSKALAEKLCDQYERQFPEHGYLIVTMKVRRGPDKFEPVRPRANHDRKPRS